MQRLQVCTPKYLPPDLVALAAQTATEINPVNSLASLAQPEHAAVDQKKYWGSKGCRLTVGFMEAIDRELRERIMAAANEWDKYGNVTFTWSQTDPQIRITRSGNQYWSYVGPDLLLIPKNEPTMMLGGMTIRTSDREVMRVVPHEFGHSAGLVHEHMRADIVNQIDRAKAYRYFAETQGWSRAMVDSQVLRTLEEQALLATPQADETSIMTYQIPGEITKSGRPILGGVTLSEFDKRFIAEIYPEAVIPKPDGPKVDDLQMKMDFANKTVSIRLPSGWQVVKFSDN